MALMVWDPALETGDPMVDEQHRGLIAMVNEFHAAVAGRRSKELVLHTLERVADYADRHFQAEERLMLDAAYPDYPNHKRAHDELTAKAVEILAGYRSGLLTLPVTLGQFLQDWIVFHVQRVDKRMVEYLRARGRRAA